MKLRDYQTEAVGAVERAWGEGRRAPLLVLPTGAGKTICFAHLTESLCARGARVLIVVHRRELLHQASEKLRTLGCAHDLITPKIDYNGHPVAVGSVQTIVKRDGLFFDYVIVDEGHHAVAGSWGKCLQMFKAARVLGVTATPSRLDGRGLGDVYDHLILGPSVRDLIARGHLVRPQVYAYPVSDALATIGRRGGEYDLRTYAATELERPQITGSALEHYRKLSPNEPAIAFCASVEHALAVAREFTAAGFPFAAVHGQMSDVERARVFADYAEGRLIGLASVDLISEGTDLPFATTAILLRPTTSTALYLQQVGRVLRPAAGKTRALVLDHVGNSLEHGLPDDDRAWSLGGLKRASEARLPIRQCRTCYRVFESGQRCPWCNSVNTAPRERKLTEGAGDLVEVTAADIARFKLEKREAYRRAGSYAECLALTKKFGDKPGYAFQYWFASRGRR
jgi:superfamily II DNA or RNA helicase